MDDLRYKIEHALSAIYGHPGTESLAADFVMQVLREQEPVAWVHPTNLVNPALGIMCSPIQLGSRQVPLYAAPMPASVPGMDFDPLYRLLDYADESDCAQYGTLSTSLVRELVNEVIAAAPKPGEGK